MQQQQRHQQLCWRKLKSKREQFLVNPFLTKLTQTIALWSTVLVSIWRESMYAIWPICLCPFLDVEALLWLISLPARIVDLLQSPSAILASTFREKNLYWLCSLLFLTHALWIFCQKKIHTGAMWQIGEKKTSTRKANKKSD